MLVDEKYSKRKGERVYVVAASGNEVIFRAAISKILFYRFDPDGRYKWRNRLFFIRRRRSVFFVKFLETLHYLLKLLPLLDNQFFDSLGQPFRLRMLNP